MHHAGIIYSIIISHVLYMHLCMYVLLYVCTYVCKHICMYACIDLVFYNEASHCGLGLLKRSQPQWSWSSKEKLWQWILIFDADLLWGVWKVPHPQSLRIWQRHVTDASRCHCARFHFVAPTINVVDRDWHLIKLLTSVYRAQEPTGDRADINWVRITGSSRLRHEIKIPAGFLLPRRVFLDWIDCALIWKL